MSLALLPLLAASALSQPQLGTEFFRKDQGSSGGSFVVELFVAPDGTIEDCEIAYQERPRGDAERFCQDAKGLKAKEPAHSPDGAAAYGTILVSRVLRTDWTNSSIPDQQKKSTDPLNRSADVEISVQKLPDEVRGRLPVYVNAMVQADGSISECESDDKALTAYGNVACEQLKGIRMPVRKSHAGEAVPYVTDLKADFVTGHSSKP